MDPLERAIERLRNQQGVVQEECWAEVKRIELKIDPGGKRAIKKAKERRDGRIEVIDYVINFLENTKEEACQD